MDVRVGELQQPFPPEKEQSARSWHHAALVPADQTQGRQIRPTQRAPVRETLRSSCEVDRFGVQLGNGLLVEGFRAGAAPQFRDQRRIGRPIGRAEAHVGASRRTIGAQVMGPKRAGMHRDRDYLSFPPRDDLDLRQETRFYGIGHQAGESLLEIERSFDAGHSARAILHADQ